MSSTRTIFGRELLDLRRQPTVLRTGLIAPLIFAALMLFLPQILAKAQEPHARDHPRVAVNPGQASSELSAVITGAGFRLSEVDDVVREVSLHRALIGINVHESPDRPVSAGGSASIDILVLGQSKRSVDAAGRLTRTFQDAERTIVADRLARAGLPRSEGVAFTLSATDVGETKRGSRLQLGTLFPLLLLGEMAGPMGVAANLFATEKERRTFEPLLSLPLTSLEIVLGKALAALLLGLFSLTVFVAALLLGVMPLTNALYHTAYGLGLLDVAKLGVVGVPLAAAFASAGAFIGARARTSAQVGSFLIGTNLVMTSILLGAVIAPDFFDGNRVMSLTPVLGSLLAVRSVIEGRGLPGEVFVSLALSLAAGGLLIRSASHSLRSRQSVLRARD